MIATTPRVPRGLTARALRPEDARSVYEVMAAQERYDLGTVEIEEADIVGDWQRPSFDVGASTLGVFDAGSLVAYAELTAPERGDAAVLPSHRGRGIGTALAHWMQDLARARGERIVGMPVPQGSPADRLLATLGYHVRWTSWVLSLPPGAEVAPRALPPGWVVRPAEAAEHPAVHTVVEDAFLEWSERERQSLEDFRAVTTQRPGFEPWHLLVAVDPSGEVAGVAHLSLAPGAEDASGHPGAPQAYLARLAVRRQDRGRGLAQALMVEAFSRARAHGAHTCTLSTDSRTGALGLYERVGLQVTSTWLHRAIDLTAT